MRVATPELRVAVPKTTLPLEKVTVPVGLVTPVTVAVKPTEVPLTTLCDELCKVVVVTGRTRPRREIGCGERIPFVV